MRGGGIDDTTLKRKILCDMGLIREYDVPSMFANNDDKNNGGGDECTGEHLYIR